MLTKLKKWYDKYIVVRLLAEYVGYAFFGAVIVVAEICAHLIGGVDIPTRQQAMMDIFINYPVLFGLIDTVLYAKKWFTQRKAGIENVR